MTYERDPNHLAIRWMQWLVTLIIFPTLAALAWWKAPQFDPYTMSFFTKNYVEPTADMPEQIRIAGSVMIAIGALVGYAGIHASIKRIGTRLDSFMVLWAGAMVMAFGAAFFVAADAAQDRIEQETAGETRQA